MEMRIGVVGGGASGMMAAIFAARAGGEVTIIEHTARVGKKILSTGNGKCNFTNQNLSKDDYNGNHPSFAEPALALFDQKAAVDFFESCGMTTTSKRDGYFYPHSGQASTLLNTLRFQLTALQVRVETEVYIDKIQKESDGRFFVTAGDRKYVFDKLILACGGEAAPSTGSDGSGFRLAKMLGHKVIRPLPVLTGLKSRETCLKELAGVRAGAAVSLYVDGELVQTEEGELQLNKDTISGIPVFQLSHAAIRALDRRAQVRLTADFLPQLGMEEVLARIGQNLMTTYAELPASEVIAALVHKKVCGSVLRRAGISFDKKTGELTHREVRKIAGFLKEFSFDISAYPGFEAAQATMGGVDTRQINAHTMMSENVEGLYFTGEIVDIDGRCGGYNLQWAWSSGYVAGCHSVSGEVTCYESTSVK